MQSSDFIQALPKAELHLHLEGAVPWAMIEAQGMPGSPPWWADDYRFDNFSHFAQVIRRCYESTLTSIENYHLAARGIFDRLVTQNVRYVELSFSLGHALSQKLPLPEIVKAIQQAAPDQLMVRVFCGVSRSRPELLQGSFLEAILNLPGLAGLDLHGDENAQGPAPFARLFAQAKQCGLATKAHAGELAGPDSLATIIDTLHLTRIEHGVTAIQDERLMARLANEAITLDLCPTSNFKLRVVEDIITYPLKQFQQRGIRVTVSTDNPTILGCTLTDELHLLLRSGGLSLQDLAQLQINAFQAAIIPPARRSEILAEIDHILAQQAN